MKYSKTQKKFITYLDEKGYTFVYDKETNEDVIGTIYKNVKGETDKWGKINVSITDYRKQKGMKVYIPKCLQYERVKDYADKMIDTFEMTINLEKE